MFVPMRVISRSLAKLCPSALELKGNLLVWQSAHMVDVLSGPIKGDAAHFYAVTENWTTEKPSIPGNRRAGYSSASQSMSMIAATSASVNFLAEDSTTLVS
jgi:hypothetical protein